MDVLNQNGGVVLEPLDGVRNDRCPLLAGGHFGPFPLLHAQALDGVDLEHLHRAGHVADLVASILEGNMDAGVVVRQTAHDPGHLAQRPTDQPSHEQHDPAPQDHHPQQDQIILGLGRGRHVAGMTVDLAGSLGGKGAQIVQGGVQAIEILLGGGHQHQGGHGNHHRHIDDVGGRAVVFGQGRRHLPRQGEFLGVIDARRHRLDILGQAVDVGAQPLFKRLHLVLVDSGGSPTQQPIGIGLNAGRPQRQPGNQGTAREGDVMKLGQGGFLALDAKLEDYRQQDHEGHQNQGRDQDLDGDTGIGKPFGQHL